MKKFVVSTADVRGYTEAGELMFEGKTLLDSSIETSLANTDVRAGRGNALHYQFFHTAEMNIQINDAQWNLDMLALNIGSDVLTGNNIFFEEEITLGSGGAGTVTKTPLALFGSNILGWVTLTSGVIEKVTFSTKDFTATGGAEGDKVIVRYFVADSASRSITVRSDMVPSIAYLVMEAQLCSSDVSTNVIGKVEIHVPKAQMTGAFSIALSPDSVASTPLSVRALSTQKVVNGVSMPIYAQITEVVTGANWYDNVIGLSVVGGNFSMSTGAPNAKTLDVRAIPQSGAAFKPPMADLDFTSATAGVATAGLHTGVITGISAGTSLITVKITAKDTIETQVTVTVA